MSNTAKRIFATIGLLAILCLIVFLEGRGIHATRWVAVICAFGMIFELCLAIKRAPGDLIKKGNNSLIFIGFLAWLVVVLMAAYAVGVRQWIMLLLLMIISAADIGAWMFGNILGGDKMWEHISPNKTWADKFPVLSVGQSRRYYMACWEQTHFYPSCCGLVSVFHCYHNTAI